MNNAALLIAINNTMSKLEGLQKEVGELRKAVDTVEDRLSHYAVSKSYVTQHEDAMKALNGRLDDLKAKYDALDVIRDIANRGFVDWASKKRVGPFGRK